MMRSRQPRPNYTVGFLLRRLLAVAIAVALIHNSSDHVPQPHAYACGDRVPIEDVYRAVYWKQRSQNPEHEPLIPLNDVDQRRKEHPHVSTPFLPYALHWPSTDMLAGPMLFPRTFLISSLVDRLVVLVDTKNRAKGVYCSLGGSWDTALRDHLSKTYTLRPLSQFSIRDRERLLYNTGVYRFLFVRHPLSRLQVLYQNATSDGLDSESYRSFVSKVRGIPLAEGERVMQLLTPRFFVTFLSRLPKPAAEFSSQSDSCAFSKVKYHLVGHVESFASNIAKLNKRLSISGGTFTDLVVSDRDAPHREWMDKRVLSHIAKLYADDFRNFGYDMASLP